MGERKKKKREKMKEGNLEIKFFKFYPQIFSS